MAEHIDWDSMLAKVKLEDDAVGEIKPILKPCPFCGGEAFIYERYESVWRTDPTDFTVLCKGCRAGVRHYFPTKTKAIEAWNRRSDGK